MTERAPQRYDFREAELTVARGTDERGREVVALYADGRLVLSMSLAGAAEIGRRLWQSTHDFTLEG